MSPTHDLFVGSVAILLGSALFFGAILNANWLMQLAKPRLLIESIGATRTRWLLALIGAAAISIGVAIASGWRLRL